MKVLLKHGADKATAATVLILPQLIDDALETLSGESAPYGIVAETDEAALVDALNAGARARGHHVLTARALRKEAQWMSKALAGYEVGSKIGLIVKGGGAFRLDDSEAIRVNRAEGLTKGDLVAMGPTVSPRTLMNARGRVLAVKGDRVGVELDAGDCDRCERATGKQVAQRTTFPINTIEKVPESGQ